MKTYMGMLRNRLPVLLGLLACVLVPLWGVQAGGEEVAVVYSKKIPISREVALYYAQKRGIPEKNLIEIDVDAGDQISRTDFRQKMELPIHRALSDRRLMVSSEEMIPATAMKPGGYKFRCIESSIRYLVLSYGLPFRVNADPKLFEDIVKDYPEALRRNEACVDNDLALLPILGQFKYMGSVENRFAYRATNVAQLHPTNSILMVSRLDGPSVAQAKGLVDQAMEAERNGLWGRAYFDVRSIKDSAYQLGDLWITNAYRAARFVGFESVIDLKPEVFPITFPMSQIAYYVGWYAGDNTGPFSRLPMEFMPGAVAYHLHSFSGVVLRGTNGAWVGPLLARGATVTLGCVNEPYLHLTPDMSVFTVKLLLEGWTMGEAAYASMAGLSWQTIVVGDPLYRPGAKSPIQWADEFEASGHTNLDWAILRKLNFHLEQGRDPVIARQYLEELPTTAHSSVLQEKLANLYHAKGKLAEALRHYELALSLPTTPQQRLRLLQDTAELQSNFRQPAEAFEKYERILKEYPDQAWELEIRRKQLDLARDLKRKESIHFLEGEVKRLTPPAK